MAMESLSRTAEPVSNGLDSTKCGGNRPTQQFKSGDLMWIKIGKCSVWPVQVVNGETVNFKPKKKVKDGILVRKYGTYEYLYVDPLKCSSDVENILKQANISIREAFEKSLVEDLSHLKSGGKSKKTPESRADPSKRTKRKQDGQANLSPAPRVQPTRSSKRKQDEATKLEVDKQSAVEGSSEKESNALSKPKQAQKGSSKIKVAKIEKAKKVPLLARDGDVEEPHGGAITPNTIKLSASEKPASDFSARRLKVMQSLGLIAPAGSPFRRKGFVVTPKLHCIENKRPVILK